MKIENCPFCGCEFDIEVDIECIKILHPYNDCPMSLEIYIYERELFTEGEIKKIWNRRSNDKNSK